MAYTSQDAMLTAMLEWEFVACLSKMVEHPPEQIHSASSRQQADFVRWSLAYADGI